MIAMDGREGMNVHAAPSSGSGTGHLSLSGNLFSQLRQFIAAESLNTSERNLMLKLIEKLKLSHIIINLGQHSEGFNLQVSVPSAEATSQQLQTIHLPYDQNELLQYIDREQICPYLVELIEGSPALQQANLFHQGRLIVEVRDYRRGIWTHARPDKHFDRTIVILKPSDLNIIHEVGRITDPFNNGGVEWTPEERHQLESQLILKANPDLSLDVRSQLFYVQNRVQFKKKLFNQHHFRRLSRRCSSHGRSVRQNLMSMAYGKQCPLGEFLESRSDQLHRQRSTRCQPQMNPSVPSDLMIQSSLSSPTTAVTDKILEFVQKSAVPVARPPVLDVVPSKIEEYKFEYLDSDKRQSTTHVSIFYRQVDDIYRCELRSSKIIPGMTSTSSTTCKFEFNTKDAVKRYLNQYKEILTENGRKPVKITCFRPTVPEQAATQPSTSTVQTAQQPPINTTASITQKSVTEPTKVSVVPQASSCQSSAMTQMKGIVSGQQIHLVADTSQPQTTLASMTQLQQPRLTHPPQIQLVSGQGAGQQLNIANSLTHAPTVVAVASAPNSMGQTQLISHLGQQIQIAPASSLANGKLIQITNQHIQPAGITMKTDVDMKGLCAIVPHGTVASSGQQPTAVRQIVGATGQMTSQPQQQAVTFHILTPSKTLSQHGNVSQVSTPAGFTQLAHLVQLQSQSQIQSHGQAHPQHATSISVPVSLTMLQAGSIQGTSTPCATGGPTQLGNISIMNISRPLASSVETSAHPNITTLAASHDGSKGHEGSGQTNLQGQPTQTVIMQPVMTSLPFNFQPVQVLHLPSTATGQAIGHSLQAGPVNTISTLSSGRAGATLSQVTNAVVSEAPPNQANNTSSTSGPSKGKPRKK